MENIRLLDDLMAIYGDEHRPQAENLQTLVSPEAHLIVVESAQGVTLEVLGVVIHTFPPNVFFMIEDDLW